MSNPPDQSTRQGGQVPADDARTRIMRERAVSDSEARLAAAIDAAASPAPFQMQEDAFELPAEGAPQKPADGPRHRT